MAVAVAQEFTSSNYMTGNPAIYANGVGTSSVIVVGVSSTSPGTVGSISDNAGTPYTWSVVKALAFGLANDAEVWVGTGGSGGSFTITVTIANTSGFNGILGFELTGCNTTTPVDTSNDSSLASATSFTTVTMTPSSAGELVFFFVCDSGAGGIATPPSSPWVVDNSSLNGYGSSAYQTGVANGTGYSTTWGAANADWIGIGVVFQAPSVVSANSGFFSVMGV